MADSIPEAYFKKFTAPGAATLLASLPTASEKTFENDWLDFKSCIDPRTPTKFIDDKKIEDIWGKALGGMANAGGGVLVWGLTAEKAGDPPIDAVSALALVPDVDLLKSKLIEIRRVATDPVLHGVKIEAIPQAPGAREGFVVCLIPLGEHRPYESIKWRRYFFRAGDSTSPAQRSILHQLFNPQARTRAKLYVDAKRNGTTFTLKCSLKNKGSISIENGLICADITPIIHQDGKAHVNRKPLANEHGMPSVLHPLRSVEFSLALVQTDYSEEFVVCVRLFQRNHEAKWVNFHFFPNKHEFLDGSKTLSRTLTASFESMPSFPEVS